MSDYEQIILAHLTKAIPRDVEKYGMSRPGAGLCDTRELADLIKLPIDNVRRLLTSMSERGLIDAYEPIQGAGNAINWRLPLSPEDRKGTLAVCWVDTKTSLPEDGQKVAFVLEYDGSVEVGRFLLAGAEGHPSDPFVVVGNDGRPTGFTADGVRCWSPFPAPDADV